MPSKRWIRLDVAWEDSAWLDAIDGTAAGNWPRLLCLVKRDGVRGRVKRPSFSVLARKWRVPVESIETLEKAAIEDGAIVVENGEWLVTNFVDMQTTDPTASERVKKYRKEKSRLSPLHGDTRNTVTKRSVLSRATETETETIKETSLPPGGGPNVEKSQKKRGAQLHDTWRPNAAHRQLADSLNVDIALEYDRFRDHAAEKGRVAKDWDAAFRNWLRKAREIKQGNRPPAGSEAARVRNELPGKGRTTQAEPLHDEVSPSGTHRWDTGMHRWVAI